MTSEDRRNARYQRRRAAREAKAAISQNRTCGEVMSFENLLRAGKQACNSARWKSSTIFFESDMIGECDRIYEDIHSGTRKFKGFQSFSTIEHGKRRDIDALPIQERTAQKCMCRNFLVAAYSRSFVYDNCASLENKGMDFMLARLKKHLRDHYRKHGVAGGIFQFDFSGYFGSLPHDEIKARARKRMSDDRLYELFCQYVDDFQKRRTADQDASSPHGVGLGSEISQIIALDYASPIDHYVKEERSIHGYGRYMDDGYVISENLDELRSIRDAIFKLSQDMGLTLNPKKCVITPFKHHAFSFLKMRVRLTDSGCVVMKPNRKSIRAMRRKLMIFRRWCDEGRMEAESIFQSYQSWRAHMLRSNSHETLQNMDKRFIRLFEDELRVRKRRFPCTIPARKTEKGWVYGIRNPQTV